jgi:predicted nucleotidyltransferase
MKAQEAIPTLGRLDLRDFPERDDPGLKLVLEISRTLPPQDWLLVGGQMVLLHALHARVDRVRVTRDVDLLADILAHRNGMNRVVQALRSLDFVAEPTLNETKQHRFIRSRDGAVADVLAPDHADPRHPLRTEGSRETIKIPGGSQALQRRTELTVVIDENLSGIQVPLPTLLGAIVLKAAAWVEDNRDPERHLQDAALLVSLVDDPLAEREALKGSDRKRLNKLNKALGDEGAEHWEMLGGRANDAFTKWQLLIDA